MSRALDLARVAAAMGEVPVGAVVTDPSGQVVAEAHNRTRADRDPTAHAELLAIRRATAALGTERLAGLTLWVTLEPCAMCAGAIALARLSRLVYAAPDPKAGAVVNGPRLFGLATCHHRPEVVEGLGAAEASQILKDFFARLRRGDGR
ncbi:MAG: nucleoside deaminase [Sphingomonadaceae bacterium]|uniref:nucleoside deaminase n=1 Tax=Thermaurantiacus sp. TaxID=2820283 RepID=UPI00298F33C5|nr:nucleoside deaminase [Thermaurantiacus sp.]MCS6987454.1 nucleoside deaminase [Sphingomonadaceae bacterium]MDW8415374.1 nucleoside deaminase [Thermaurantiacus sp.]